MKGRTIALLAALALSACATLQDHARSALGVPEFEGTRWGLVVITMDGRELVAIRPDERFKPASNTKLFTVAAAFHRLGDITTPDPSAGASVRIVPQPDGAPPDIVLVGGGDATLIDADDCERNCLSVLADMVVANGFTAVGSVTGDDQLFPDERWGPGWSQEDLIYRPGAPVSALTVNSNEVALEIRPGIAVNDRVQADWRKGDDYFLLANAATTIEEDRDALRIDRQRGAGGVALYGELGRSRRPQTIPLAVDDPAMTAAWRFKNLLEARGVAVEGPFGSRHRKLSLEDDPATRRGDRLLPTDVEGSEIARLLPPPLIEDVRFLMKQSQNQHAEVLLRRLGLVEGRGSRADGLAIVEAMLAESGADRVAWDLQDGSGMSVYNRVTPRMMARFLRWTSMQPWGEAFRDTLPVGGVDGTLARRFRGTSLEGRIFAKTGTLEETNALAGFMLTEKGEMLIFSAYANDRPSGAGSAAVALDNALLAIASRR